MELAGRIRQQDCRSSFLSDTIFVDMPQCRTCRADVCPGASYMSHPRIASDKKREKVNIMLFFLKKNSIVIKIFNTKELVLGRISSRAYR
ncbi:MAG: hypothetical protein FWH56_10155 [Betaproteobacteria bacterium]|nr:hypothetical protein [Betaproteobacteria bacterium]